MTPLLQQLEPPALASLLIAGVLLFSLTLGLYVIKPSLLDLRALQQSQHLLAQGLQSGTHVDAEMRTAESQISTLRGKLQGDSASLASEELEAEVIAQLQHAAWSQGVMLDSVTPGASRKALGFVEISFEVGLRGEYRSLYDWISELEQRLGFVLIQHYNISETQPVNSAHPLTMRLVLVFYRKPQ